MLLVFACSEQDALLPADPAAAVLQPELSQHISVENGYLAFTDFEHLSTVRRIELIYR